MPRHFLDVSEDLNGSTIDMAIALLENLKDKYGGHRMLVVEDKPLMVGIEITDLVGKGWPPSTVQK